MRRSGPAARTDSGTPSPSSDSRSPGRASDDDLPRRGPDHAGWARAEAREGVEQARLAGARSGPMSRTSSGASRLRARGRTCATRWSRSCRLRRVASSPACSPSVRARSSASVARVLAAVATLAPAVARLVFGVARFASAAPPLASAAPRLASVLVSGAPDPRSGSGHPRHDAGFPETACRIERVGCQRTRNIGAPGRPHGVHAGEGAERRHGRSGVIVG